MPDIPPSDLLLDGLRHTPIRLIVADIDGCLTRGTGFPFDHELLQTFARANEASRTDAAVPAITLCTGRPQPYVECMMQAIAGYLPALCESGTVFFDPPTHSILMHPEFGERQQEQLNSLRAKVMARLGNDRVKPEPGKLSHITLIIQEPYTPEELLPAAEEIVAEFGDVFYVEKSRICLHFLFRNIHKGVGLDWLSQVTNIPLNQMAGIGDATPDIPFLSKVGYAFAPANAHGPVKEACHRVSERRESAAALELLEKIVAHNCRLQKDGLLSTVEVTAG